MLAEVGLTLQDGAIAALLFMVSFSGVLLTILWNRSIACEKRDKEMQKTLLAYQGRVSTMEGMLKVMKLCPIEECPFRPHLPDRNEHHDTLLEWPVREGE